MEYSLPVDSYAMPAQMDLSNPIIFTRGIINSQSSDILFLYAWIKDANMKPVDKRDITVSLLDETGTAVVTWKLIAAFPIRLDAPSFDASSNDPAIESLQVLAKKIEITNPEPSTS